MLSKYVEISYRESNRVEPAATDLAGLRSFPLCLQKLATEVITVANGMSIKCQSNKASTVRICLAIKPGFLVRNEFTSTM